MNLQLLQTNLEQAERGKFAKISDINSIISKIGVIEEVKNNKKITYYNIPCSFDIETSSNKSIDWTKTEKVAFMYEWSFCIYGYVIIGRTWEEFNELIDKLIELFNIDINHRLIIYVHNLNYEFQFIRKRFIWDKVFSIKMRKPIQALTVDGIEFRCSYLLSGYSLAKLGEQLRTFKIRKKEGDLDYNLIRTSITPLNSEEIQYCINDVLVVVAYIAELIIRLGNITKIPLTKTGFVRNYCRNSCLYEGSHKHNTEKFHKYRKIMKSLILTKDEYKICNEVFSGGFTHANPMYVDMLMKNVTSFDECSAYPYVLISEKFPMSRPIKTKVHSMDEFYKTLQLYCCMFVVEFTNIQSTIVFENYISKSHCRKIEDGKFYNGRVVSAKKLIIALTEQDYFIIHRTYKWEDSRIWDLYKFEKQYLPTDFIKAILKFYIDKTELKGVEGKGEEYMVSKENLNSCYGMTVTDICRDEIKYESIEWTSEKPDIDKVIEKYNKSVKRFLYYPWGVWVTAYARANLWLAILEFGEDYLYSDTDSVKVINVNNHTNFIEKYNKNVVKKLDRAMQYHGLPLDSTRPKTIEGKTKQLGIWENEGVYDFFKTLGAKRYMVKKDKALGKYNYSLTVSGINKNYAIPYLIDKYGDKIFAYFQEGLYIPPEYTGKLTHTYIDDEKSGVVKDYLGNYCKFHELSAVHLEPADYHLDVTEELISYIFSVQEE